MEEITINFGLVASEKFPAVARSRVLTTGTNLADFESAAHYSAINVLNVLVDAGCAIQAWSVARSKTEPTLVVKVLYPVSSEKADCAPPSVLRYEKYMRLHEVACWAAQDCVAVLEADGTGVLVGANCSDWGCSFDKTKFITLGE